MSESPGLSRNQGPWPHKPRGLKALRVSALGGPLAVIPCSRAPWLHRGLRGLGHGVCLAQIVIIPTRTLRHGPAVHPCSQHAVVGTGPCAPWTESPVPHLRTGPADRREEDKDESVATTAGFLPLSTPDPPRTSASTSVHRESWNCLSPWARAIFSC